MYQRTIKQSIFASACGAVALIATPALAGNYTYTVLDAPGASQTFVNGINSAGTVAGTFISMTDGQSHGFTWSNGVFTAFDAPLARQHVAFVAINDAGTIAYQTDPPHEFYGHIYIQPAAGGAHQLHVAGSTEEAVVALNRSGTAIGLYISASAPNTVQAFIDQHGTAQTIMAPGGGLARPQSINKAGAVAGFYDPPGAFKGHGFVLQGGTFTTIDPPGSDATVVTSINDQGVLAGYFEDTAKHDRQLGFIYANGAYKVIRYPDPAAVSTVAAFALSPRQIYGEWINDAGSHVFALINGAYSTLQPPGAVSAFLSGVTASGTLAGVFMDSNSVAHGFTAVCPAGQAPCTQ